MKQIAVNSTLLAFYRHFGHLLNKPVSPALIAAVPEIVDVQPGQSCAASFADGSERIIRRDSRGFLFIDPLSSRHMED